MKKQIIIIILILTATAIIYFNYPKQTELSPQECLEQGGRTLNIVGGATCEEHETNIGKVIGFISPNICCTSLVGSSCGTVNPDNADECCYRKFKENNNFPTCSNALIFYNIEKTKCDFECRTEPVACTEDAKDCGDGTWTSRTGALNCKFIPCGYQ